MSDYETYSDEDFPLFSSVNQSCVIEKNKLDEDSSSEKRRIILEALTKSDLSCVEVETRWHRGQAVICTLRGLGHVIDTVRGVYKYRGFNKDMVKTNGLQQKYYETEHWREMARKRKERDSFTCVQCGCKEELETHHWRYELFDEKLEDLTTLCVDCHRSMHECVKGSSVHFPRYVSKEIADRITSDGIDN